MSRIVKLKDYLSGGCIYKGCKFNECGSCMNNTEEFIEHIAELVEGEDKSEFECNWIEVTEYHCEFCGHKLNHYVEFVDFCGGRVPFTYLECHNPNC